MDKIKIFGFVFSIVLIFLLFHSQSVGALTRELGSGYEIEIYKIGNSDNCFIDCYLDLTFKLNQNYYIDSLNKFKMRFVKQLDTSDLVDYGIKLLQNETIEKEIWVNDGNCETIDSINFCDGHYETIEEQVSVWNNFNPLGKTIQANKWYTIRLWGKKKPELGENNIDAIPQLFNNDFTEWAWWNSTFNKSVAITANTTVSTVSGFQLLINVPYDSDMNNDFSDLRFSDPSNTTELDYWIADKVDGVYANIWVEIIQPITSTNNIIAYMWYGNVSNIISNSNGFETFIFFDDFEDGDSTNNVSWSILGGSQPNCTYQVIDFGGNYVFNISEEIPEMDCGQYAGTMPTNRSYTIEGNFYNLWQTGGTIYSMKMGIETNPSTDISFFGFSNNTNYNLNFYFVQSGVSSGWITHPNTNPPVFSNKWNHYRIDFTNSSNNATIFLSDGFDNYSLEYQYQLNNDKMDNNGYFLISTGRGGALYDNIMIREYNNSIIYYEISNIEEIYIPPEPAIITIINPQNITYVDTLPIAVNVTTDINVDNCLLDFAGSNVSLAGSGTNWYGEINNISAGTYQILIYCMAQLTYLNSTNSTWFTYYITPVIGELTNVTIQFIMETSDLGSISRSTCQDNNTLIHEWIISDCIAEYGNFTTRCYNYTRYKIDYCAYGCYEDISLTGDGCAVPDYTLYIIAFIIIILAFIGIRWLK